MIKIVVFLAYVGILCILNATYDGTQDNTGQFSVEDTKNMLEKTTHCKKTASFFTSYKTTYVQQLFLRYALYRDRPRLYSTIINKRWSLMLPYIKYTNPYILTNKERFFLSQTYFPHV